MLAAKWEKNFCFVEICEETLVSELKAKKC